MADVNRVALHNPAADSGVIEVPEDAVDRFLAAGWERVSGGRRRADTGSNPTIDTRRDRESRRQN
jgi:hypothetical protein